MTNLSAKTIATAVATILVLLAIVFGALAYSDFYDPEPTKTVTSTCEPIGAQHPKSETVPCPTAPSDAP